MGAILRQSGARAARCWAMQPSEPQGCAQRGRGGAGGQRVVKTTGHLRAQILYYIAENLTHGRMNSPTLDAMQGGKRAQRG